MTFIHQGSIPEGADGLLILFLFLSSLVLTPKRFIQTTATHDHVIKMRCCSTTDCYSAGQNQYTSADRQYQVAMNASVHASFMHISLRRGRAPVLNTSVVLALQSIVIVALNRFAPHLRRRFDSRLIKNRISISDLELGDFFERITCDASFYLSSYFDLSFIFQSLY